MTGVPGARRCSSRSTSSPAPSGSLRSRRTAAGRFSSKSRRPSPTEAAAAVRWPRACRSSTHELRTVSSSSTTRISGSHVVRHQSSDATMAVGG